MGIKKYLILLSVTWFAATGDIMLAKGMKQLGPISPHHWQHLFSALGNPWILFGILLLIAFFTSYLTALSWADLSYVLPATALGYVVVALLSKFFLHETVSAYRWMGILLISGGVGWVTQGPALTEKSGGDDRPCRVQEQHEIA